MTDNRERIEALKASSSQMAKIYIDQELKRRGKA